MSFGGLSVTKSKSIVPSGTFVRFVVVVVDEGNACCSARTKDWAKSSVLELIVDVAGTPCSATVGRGCLGSTVGCTLGIIPADDDATDGF